MTEIGPRDTQRGGDKKKRGAEKNVTRIKVDHETVGNTRSKPGVQAEPTLATDILSNPSSEKAPLETTSSPKYKNPRKGSWLFYIKAGGRIKQ
ncbi:hypothetical protein AVEN_240016-1 [Araneus ventricosus]|uniref:Uncharacterized protein n=1 Tax=Araneus ventricosus TaxID=182803 RepID=A0A4Y2RZE6_ARAVE|nr:hypothetical protein AVEN_104843-1 [Araneus ventricosus]GBN81266.1 hypothetical protein AVEN_240016-1 [Araneus ventricosus]